MKEPITDSFEVLCHGRNDRRRTPQVLLGYLKRNFLHSDKLDYKFDGDMIEEYASPTEDMLVSAYFENSRLAHFEAINFTTQKRALIYNGRFNRLRIAVGDMDENFSYMISRPEVRRPNTHADIKKAQQTLRLLKDLNKNPS